MSDYVVPEKEAAIVTNGEDFELLIPDYGDDDNMPPAILALTAVYMRLKDDPEYMKMAVDWFHNLVEAQKDDGEEKASANDE